MLKIKKAIFLTGANGDIGSNIGVSLKKNNFIVIGTDKQKYNKNKFDEYLQIDFNNYFLNKENKKKIDKKISTIIKSYEIYGLINNAALQIKKPFSKLSLDDLNNSLNINLKTPFLLSQILFNQLKKNNGKIINISSIHSKLSKSNFLAYSVTKSAIDGFTRSLAIEMGEYISVIGVVPAAIKTKMLEKGLSNNSNKIENLKNFHPTKTIGTPEDIAELILFLIQAEAKFLNGSIINIDGAISHRLHDPE